MSRADLTATSSTKDAVHSSLAGSTGDGLNQWKAENLIPARHHHSFASFGAGAVQAWGVKHLWLATHGIIDEKTARVKENTGDNGGNPTKFDVKRFVMSDVAEHINFT